jgi:DNA-binding CsgD family transcriptional regulator
MAVKSLNSLFKKLIVLQKAKSWSSVIEILSEIKFTLDEKLYRDISRLFNERYSLSAISRQLNLPYQKIYFLFKSHNARPLKRGRKSNFDEAQTVRLLNKIREMRKKGIIAADIAKVLNISLSKVNTIVYSSSEIMPIISRTRKLRDEKIVQMFNEGKTYKDIGKALDVTKQRVEQILLRLKDKLKTGTTLVEIAEATNLSYPTVKRYVAIGVIKPSFIRGSSSKRYYFDMPETLKAIEEYRTRPIVCETCPKILNTTKKRFCEDCSVQRQADHHNGVIKSKFTGWRQTVKQLIGSRPVKDEEEWIPLAEAGRISGLSKMQLIWLRSHGAVHTKNSEHPRWRKQKLFALSEVSLAGIVAKNNLETASQVDINS